MLAAKRSIRIRSRPNPWAIRESAHSVHHALGAADERVVDVVDRYPGREQRVSLGAIDAAVQELDVLRLARQHVDQIEAFEMQILERCELVAKHHGRRRPVAVDQREFRARFGRERRRDDRQQRCDAAAGRDTEIVADRLRIGIDVEMAHRRHDVDVRAGTKRVVRPYREHAARRALDRDSQRIARGGADRIGASYVLAADVGAQRQVLAGLEAEQVTQHVGNGERDGDRVACLTVDSRDLQRMELAHLDPHACALTGQLGRCAAPTGAEFASRGGPSTLTWNPRLRRAASAA